MSGNLLGLEINGEFVPCEISCEFNFEAELRPASPVTSGRWKEWIAGVRTWSISLNAAMLLRMLDGASLPVVLNAFMTGELLGVRFMVRNTTFPNFILSGNALVQSGSIGSTVNVLAGWNTVLMGNGPFEAEINTNLVYVLATDDVGDELVEDGDLNLIVADPGTGQEVTVGYELVKGYDPITENILVIDKNGTTQHFITAESTGVLAAGSFVGGDTITGYQIAYPSLRAAPGSNWLLQMIVDGVTVYSASVTSQAAVSLQNNPAYVIPDGVTGILFRAIGSNESLNYFTKALQVNTSLVIDEFELDISDNIEAGLGLQNSRPGGMGIWYAYFNVKGTTGLLTVVLKNLKVTDIIYNLVGAGGYTQTGTIPGGGSVTHADVPKDGLVIDVSDI